MYLWDYLSRKYQELYSSNILLFSHIVIFFTRKIYLRSLKSKFTSNRKMEQKIYRVMRPLLLRENNVGVLCVYDEWNIGQRSLKIITWKW